MKFLCVLLFAAAAMAAEIPKGAHVLLRLENSVNTRTAQKGDFVYLRTAVPIANAGVIAVPAGSYVQGVVTDARRSGRVKGRAQLAIRLETLTLASGKVYKFAPHLSAVDAGETGQKVVGGRERHRAGAQPGPGCSSASQSWRAAEPALGASPTEVGKALGSAQASGRPWGWPPCCSRAARKWSCGRDLRWMWFSTGRCRWNNA